MFQMIGADWCDKCRQAKKLIQERGLWDLIEYIEYDSPEGKQIAAKFGIDKIPFFVADGNPLIYVGEILSRLTEERIKQNYGSVNNDEPGDS